MSNSNQYRKGHKLANQNLETLTATCKICGDVHIVKAAVQDGKQYYRCENAFERKSNRPHYSKSHLLSDINPETGMATCAVCGPIKVYGRKNRITGKMSWACSVSSKESKKKLLVADRILHPRRVAHSLLEFNPEARTGVCSICGPVDIVVRGSVNPNGGFPSTPSDKFYWRCRNSVKGTMLKWAYGVTLETYQQKYEELGGCCEICGEHQEVLHMDHCHELGDQGVKNCRGALCCACNNGLGNFRDNPAFLASAIQYLLTRSGGRGISCADRSAHGEVALGQTIGRQSSDDRQETSDTIPCPKCQGHDTVGVGSGDFPGGPDMECYTCGTEWKLPQNPADNPLALPAAAR